MVMTTNQPTATKMKSRSAITRVIEKNWGMWSLSIFLTIGLRMRNVKNESTKGIETSLDAFNIARTMIETIIPRNICIYRLEVWEVSVMKQL